MIKILLMEDDLDLCQSIQQALKKEGYSVDCCNDGESSMIYALNTDYGYDLAIVDRMLPIIDHKSYAQKTNSNSCNYHYGNVCFR